MGPVGFEPTTASAPGQYLDEINQIGRVGILDQARRWPLRLRQMESFLNVVLCHFQHEIDLIQVDNGRYEVLKLRHKMKNLNPINLVILILHKQNGLH